MLRRTISLLLPTLFPSWRFFMTVGPSPRVEYRMFDGDTVSSWTESDPIPQKVTLAGMVGHLFWNHPRNTQLYMVALAERQIAVPSAHSLAELHRLIAARHGSEGAQQQFRLVFLMRDGAEMLREVLFESDVIDVTKAAQ